MGRQSSVSMTTTVILTLCIVGLKSVYSCPLQCTCTSQKQLSLDVVSCANKSLDTVPEHLPGTTRTLDLHSNRLTELTSVFPNLILLQHIDLSFNQIKFIANSTFASLNALVVLNLSYNSLTEITKEMFNGLSSLGKLFLEHNNIINVDPFWMSELFRLEAVNLSSNNVTSLSKQSFVCSQHTPILELDLSYNNISVISELDFVNMTNLKILVLDANPLDNISSSAFHQLANLSTLSLSNMPFLSSLSQNALAGLERLTKLNLSYNPHLSFIHRDLFKSLVSLKTLDLGYNNISTLVNDTFQNNLAMSTINLIGNSFKCDCSISWLFASLRDNSSVFSTSTNQDLQCSMPDTGLQVLASTVTEDDLMCSQVYIRNYSQDPFIKVGASVNLRCDVMGDQEHNITWVTPSNLVLTYQNFLYQHEKGHHPTLKDVQPNGAFHKGHVWHNSWGYYGDLDSRADRIVILEDGSLYIDYMLRSDAGPYECIAENALNKTSIRIDVKLNYDILIHVKIWSYLFGFISAGGFFFLNLIHVIITAITRRCINQRRRQAMRHIVENFNTYKTNQVSQLKDNYNAQVNKIRTNYHNNLTRLRENYTTNSTRIKEGCSNQVDKIRDNYNFQLSKLKEYSSHQMEQLRERYNQQMLKVRDYGSLQLDRVREKYKLKQRHIIKVLETMNIDNCRTAFDTECVKTESMMFDDNLPIESVPSPVETDSESEYVTATNSETSSLTVPENLALEQSVEGLASVRCEESSQYTTPQTGRTPDTEMDDYELANEEISNQSESSVSHTPTHDLTAVDICSPPRTNTPDIPSRCGSDNEADNRSPKHQSFSSGHTNPLEGAVSNEMTVLAMQEAYPKEPSVRVVDPGVNCMASMSRGVRIQMADDSDEETEI